MMITGNKIRPIARKVEAIPILHSRNAEEYEESLIKEGKEIIKTNMIMTTDKITLIKGENPELIEK